MNALQPPEHDDHEYNETAIARHGDATPEPIRPNLHYDDSGADDEDHPEGDETRAALLGSPDARIRGREGLFPAFTLQVSKQDADIDDVGNWAFAKGLLTQAAPTLWITVFGMVFTGELLERVSRWTALRTTDELFVLIPIISNLKGNLEMNLSARLGTAANMGLLHERATRQPLIKGNLLLLQVQALLVSAVAAALSFVLGVLLPSREKMPLEMPQDSLPPAAESGTSSERARFLIRQVVGLAIKAEPPVIVRTWGSRFREFFTVLTTAMASASMSGLILGSFMCSLVLICQKYRLNPDNIAPPIASCLGDLLTLTLLALSSTALLYIPSPLPFLFLLCLLGLAVLALRAALRNDDVRHLVGSGWSPLFGAMIISTGTGIVLEKFVKKYEGFGLMAVVISGLPGSIGAVSISRLSTLLHASGPIPRQESRHLRSLKWNTVAPPSHRPSLTAVTLFAIALPVQLTFLGFVYAAGWMDLPFLFVGTFIAFFCISVLSSLTIAHFLTLAFWSNGYDPDNYCLPVHSALCDLVGQLLLVACYELVGKLGGDVDLRRRR